MSKKSESLKRLPNPAEKKAILGHLLVEPIVRVTAECGLCGDEAMDDIEQGDLESARRTFAEELHKAGWRVAYSADMEVDDLQCPRCLAEGRKGAP